MASVLLAASELASGRSRGSTVVGFSAARVHFGSAVPFLHRVLEEQKAAPAAPNVHGVGIGASGVHLHLWRSYNDDLMGEGHVDGDLLPHAVVAVAERGGDIDDLRHDGVYEDALAVERR
eukprot:scaffold2853_cov246-Pinguiococcus_pyrenoidosus.AAC.7